MDSLCYFMLAKILFCVTLVYASPTSTIRPICSLIIAGLCLVSVRSTIVNLVPGHGGTDYVIAFAIQSNYWLCIVKLQPPNDLKNGNALRWAASQAFSHRWNIAPQNLPPFDSKNPSKIPGRREFVLREIFNIAWIAVAICMLEWSQSSIDLIDIISTENGFLYRLSSIPSQEMLMRSNLAFCSLALPFLSLWLSHSIAACIAVSLGGSPASWRPIYGSIADAYTVKRFWNVFWHSLMRKAFVAHATMIMYMLRVSPKKEHSRYVVIVGVFLISGIMHIASSPEIPLSCAYGELRYQFWVAAAVILEDIVTIARNALGPSAMKGEPPKLISAARPQTRSSKSTKRQEDSNNRTACESSKVRSVTRAEPKSRDRTHRPNIALRLLGYCWVTFFFVSAISPTIYGVQKCVIKDLVEKLDV